MNFTADSKHYINVAQQIYQNGFITIWKNEQLVYWPPLYPIVLSFIIETESFYSLKILHFLLAVSILTIWEKISIDILKNSRRHLVFMVFLSISTNFLMISVFIWSELLFLMLLSFMILCINNYIKSANSNWLLISILPAFLMLIQRNAGIFVITAIYLSLFVFKIFTKKNISLALVCYLTSISGFLVWNIKTIIVEERPYMIAELVPYFTLTTNFNLLVNEIGSIFYPSYFIYPFSILISCILIIYTSYIIFNLDNDVFLKILLLSALLYLSIWIIIPGDPSNMGRFISIAAPMILLSVVKVIFTVSEVFSVSKNIKFLIIGVFIFYSSLRITNNSLLWGGMKKYIDFGQIHENTFYEKSNRVIGRPAKE